MSQQTHEEGRTRETYSKYYANEVWSIADSLIDKTSINVLVMYMFGIFY